MEYLQIVVYALVSLLYLLVGLPVARVIIKVLCGDARNQEGHYDMSNIELIFLLIFWLGIGIILVIVKMMRTAKWFLLRK